MVLSSQSPRPDGARTYMSSAYGRRRRWSLWPWLGLVIVVVIVVAGYKYLSGGQGVDSARQASGKNAVAPQAGAPVAVPAKTPAPAPAAEPQPPTITFAAPPAHQPAASLPATPAPDPLRTSPPAAPAPTPPAPSASINLRATPSDLRQGMSLIEQGQYVEGRAMLSRLLIDRGVGLDPRDAEAVRQTLASVNEQMVFSPKVTTGDPLAEAHEIRSGDLLVRLAPPYNITPQLLQRINKVDPQRLMVGQKLKAIKGPFHAVIDKSEFRMDVFLDGPQGRVYVRSFPVGLGKEDSTPVGTWLVKASGKLVNPGWTSPETNQYYAPDDPQNPIGERWIGLEGTSPTTAGKTGYGIHGTIQPESIGRQMSLGCIRLRPEDVELAYDLLVDGKSTVEVRP